MARTLLNDRGLAPPLPPGINYRMSFEDFSDLVQSCRDSGVGPDGILYSCWKYMSKENLKLL